MIRPFQAYKPHPGTAGKRNPSVVVLVLDDEPIFQPLTADSNVRCDAYTDEGQCPLAVEQTRKPFLCEAHGAEYERLTKRGLQPVLASHIRESVARRIAATAEGDGRRVVVALPEANTVFGFSEEEVLSWPQSALDAMVEDVETRHAGKADAHD
jgi:hypothetical protein